MQRFHTVVLDAAAGIGGDGAVEQGVEAVAEELEMNEDTGPEASEEDTASSGACVCAPGYFGAGAACALCPPGCAASNGRPVRDTGLRLVVSDALVGYP